MWIKICELTKAKIAQYVHIVQQDPPALKNPLKLIQGHDLIQLCFDRFCFAT